MKFHTKIIINTKTLCSPREEQRWLLSGQRQKGRNTALLEFEDKVNQSRELLDQRQFDAKSNVKSVQMPDARTSAWVTCSGLKVEGISLIGFFRNKL